MLSEAPETLRQEYKKQHRLCEKVTKLQWKLTALRMELDTDKWETEWKFVVDKLRHAVSAAEAAIMSRYNL